MTLFKKREIVKRNIDLSILDKEKCELQIKDNYVYTPIMPQLQIDSDERIYYISDIHLEHKLLKKYGKSLTDSKVKKYIEKLVKDLLTDVSAMERGLSFLLIGGDVAHSFTLTKLFYEEVIKYWKKDKVVAILGNHELWDVVKNGEPSHYSLEKVTQDYTELFQSLGVTFLKNELLIVDKRYQRVISEEELLNMSSEKLKKETLMATLIIFGGTGFSGLNSKFNADSGLYRNKLDKAKDIEESEKFSRLYDKLCINLGKNKHVIIFSHMPKEDWSTKTHQAEWTYTSGHTHINTLILEDEKTVYADNQIGYFNQQMGLKSFDITKKYDLFAEYLDGIYTISSNQYQNFARGQQISMTFNRKNGHILMLKKEEMYCFLFFNLKNDRLYLLNGGMPNKLNHQDIFYYYDSMAVYSNLIKETFKNYNLLLKAMSTEVKSLGGTGKIHGNIIDVDYFNHLAVDPFNGEITPYYALSMTDRDEFSDMDDFFLSLDTQIKLNYQNRKKAGSLKMLTMGENYKLLNQENIKKVTNTDMYGPSNMMKKIQYLTENNIIRVWNEEVFNHQIKIN